MCVGRVENQNGIHFECVCGVMRLYATCKSNGMSWYDVFVDVAHGLSGVFFNGWMYFAMLF